MTNSHPAKSCHPQNRVTRSPRLSPVRELQDPPPQQQVGPREEQAATSRDTRPTTGQPLGLGHEAEQPT